MDAIGKDSLHDDAVELDAQGGDKDKGQHDTYRLFNTISIGVKHICICTHESCRTSTPYTSMPDCSKQQRQYTYKSAIVVDTVNRTPIIPS